MPQKIVEIEAARRSQVVDDFGRLAVKLEPIRKDLKRYDDLRKEIVGWYAEEPGDEAFVAEGRSYEVEISERSEERVVDIAKLQKKLGSKLFMSIVKVPMGLLDLHVAPEAQKGIVSKEQSGPRRATARRKVKEAA